MSRFQVVLSELSNTDFTTVGVSNDELNRQAVLFMNTLDQAFLLAEQNIVQKEKNPLFWNLRDAFVREDAKGVTSEVRYAFQSFMVRSRFSKGLGGKQQQLLDFRFPQEWFPGTRELQRKIHVHVGPTNSGKTYNAIKALENSKKGVYAGPLRLLANEVYQRFTAKGLPCALVTGEELRIPEDTDRYYSACTVEMVPLNIKYDVAVIDEIQMLSDPDRGGAWTSALLGVQAKEVHVCGEERAVDLVKSICASVGDECIIHRYQRLSPLETMTKSLDNDFSNLQKGDAIVAFSRLALHAIKRNVERYTGRRCAIIYGALPPEVRVQQAALFNDPNNDYDFVVASDAIGMGLNLEIRRVILETVFKFDGTQNRHLTSPEIKQIGGRAGRYRSANNPDGSQNDDASRPSAGYVTTFEDADLPSISKAFTSHVEDLKHAYIQPPNAIVERFASYYPPSTPLSFLLMRIKAAARVGDRFKLTITPESLQTSDAIQDLNMSIADKLTLCFMPIRLDLVESSRALRALATVIANNERGDLLSIKEIPLEYLDIDMNDWADQPQDYLRKMEALHVAINQYVWLSYRYSGMFPDRGLAFHVRSMVEERLIEMLEHMDFTASEMKQRRHMERVRATKRQIDFKAISQTTDQEEYRELPIDNKPLSQQTQAENEQQYAELPFEDESLSEQSQVEKQVAKQSGE